MGKAIDYEEAKRILWEEFRNAEADYPGGKSVTVPEYIGNSIIKLFDSRTQAFREVLVGCLLARIVNPQINIRLVYTNQGENAFSGRTLDEKVVNPFLQSVSIPCSRGPYLSVLRRSIRLVPETASGVRDRKAYDALMELLDKASRASADITIKHNDEVILAIEITERQVDESRLVSTFTTKIVPFGIQDYLFLFSTVFPSESARAAARKYFAQGHDISFLQIKDWLVHLLGALGIKGRKLFVNDFLQLLNEPGVPASLKVAWNDRIESLF